MNVNRRDFMGTLAAAAGAFAAGCATCGGARHLRLACQMWSVNEIWKKDPADALVKMRALCYEGVQSMAFWQWDRKELHKLLGDHGMALVDMPIYLSHVAPDKFNATVEFCKEFDVDFLFVPHFSAKKDDDWRRLADGMVEAARKLAPHGIKMGFHNHQVEFRTKIGGQSVMDLFFARPELVFELDVGHATLAGEDAVGVLRKIRGRVPSIHAKPGGGLSCGGEGDKNDWAGILSECRAMGTRWAIVECESRRNTYEDIAASSKFLGPLV